MSLTAWHRRLHNHFSHLREARLSAVGDKPIFGLEHGLPDNELKELQEEIRAHISGAPPANEHWLAWIVYASEVGYHYAGDEYWQTFESTTPGWKQYGERDWLRICFRTFHKHYGGAKPTGAWSDHFSIICWPITHAILPRDLQRQLAKTLYELRHVFSAELFQSPLELGKRIAARSWNTTSRFQNLVQEPLLIGQIAAALLLQGQQGFHSLILPATLQRIGEDLDRERQAREWLRDARRAAQERVHFRGLSRLSSMGGTTSQASVERAREEIAALAIEPRLVLLPTSPSSWAVWLEIPDLSPLLVRFPQIQPILTGLRCVVTGSSGSPLARGRLLHGPQRVLLQKWPSSADMLLHFEQSSPQLDYLLRTDCLLRPGPLWLFKIASDGRAYEVSSLVVRPECSYILVNTTGPFQLGPWAAVASVTCSGVHAVRLDLPTAIPPELVDALECLGLNLAKTVEVWPAGLAAASWDGEGRGEWLSSERPCIGIRADHPVDALLVSLEDNKTERLKIVPAAPGMPVFIELPVLPVGVHKLWVSTQSTQTGVEEELGQLEVVIREPRAWSPGVNTQGALAIVVDPEKPTLEQLWENRVAIEIIGPASRKITCTISLFEKRANTSYVQKRLPPLQLPVDATSWRSLFEKHFRDAKDVQNAYDLAHSCRLDFHGEELGTFSLACEREFSPLRWIVHRASSGYKLTLLDDSGAATSAEVYCCDFNTPDIPLQLDYAAFLKGYNVPSPGGLYGARSGNNRCEVVLPPTAKVRAFGDLRIDPRVADRTKSPEHVIKLLSLIDLWSGARLTGNLLSSTRQRDVLLALVRHVFALIGGEHWDLAERSFQDKGDSAALQNLKRAISTKRDEVGLGAALAREYITLSDVPARERVSRFASLSKSFLPLRPLQGAVAQKVSDTVTRWRPPNPGRPEWLSEFALRLASCPRDLVAWAGEDLRAGLSRLLLDFPMLARAARFLVLVIDRHLQLSSVQASRLYVGWEWE